MEYVLTGLVVAAAFAVIAYQQPVVYETLFPWLATSSAPNFRAPVHSALRLR